MARGIITTGAYVALALPAIDSAQGLPELADPLAGGEHEPFEVVHYTWGWSNPDDESQVALVCDDVVEAMVPQLIADGALPPDATVEEIPWSQ